MGHLGVMAKPQWLGFSPKGYFFKLSKCLESRSFSVQMYSISSPEASMGVIMVMSQGLLYIMGSSIVMWFIKVP